MELFSIHHSLPKPHLVQSQSHTQNHLIHKTNQSTPQITNKRTFNLSLIALFLSPYSFPYNLPFPIANAVEQGSDGELEKYTNSEQGFTLLRPTSYIKVDKAGATVLFEEVSKGANNVGVVVTPVRLSSLKDFGTPQFVADKLIQAEKRKESTNAAEVIGVGERLGFGGMPVYEFEYVVDSTRGGIKRIFSSAFVSDKKLYLLNITHSDRPESPLDSHTRKMLERVLHSFDVSFSTQTST